MDPVTLGVLAGGSLLSNWMGGNAQEDAAQAAADAQIEAAQMAINEQRRAYGDVAPMWEPYSQAGEQALGDYQKQLLSGQLDLPQMGQYQYDKDVGDFLDPSMQYQQDQMREQLLASQAARGSLGSGATATALQDQASQMAMRDFGGAYDRMAQDRQFGYSDFLNQFNAKRQAIQNRGQQLQGLINTGMQSNSALTGARTGTATNVGNLMTQQGNAQAIGAMAPYQNTANRWGMLPQALGAGAAIYNNQPTAVQPVGAQPVDQSGFNAFMDTSKMAVGG